MKFDDVYLEEVQEDLFLKLAEASRNVPTSERQKFITFQDGIDYVM